MNRIVFLVIPFLAFSSLALADEAKDGKSNLFIGIGTGADLPGSNWNSDYYVGGAPTSLAAIKWTRTGPAN
jgi:hypothetical protein